MKQINGGHVDTIDTNKNEAKNEAQESQAITSIEIALTQKATAQATGYHLLAKALSDSTIP